MKKGIAIFASGGGSNAEKIIAHFQDSPVVEIRLIVSNNKAAYVLKRAKNHNVPSVLLSKQQLQDESTTLELLNHHKIDFITLAGFLLLIPEYLVTEYPKAIINIHPALLPKYGGKGMYGKHVHQAVFDNNERESGITVHYVDPAYDEGTIIFQAKTELFSTDTPDLIASKVLTLEHTHFPRVIEEVLTA